MSIEKTDNIQLRGWRPRIFMVAIAAPVVMAALLWMCLSELNTVRDRVSRGEIADIRDEVKAKAKLLESELKELRLLLMKLCEQPSLEQFISSPDEAAKSSTALRILSDQLGDQIANPLRSRCEFDRRAAPIYWENPYLEAVLLHADLKPALHLQREPQYAAPPGEILTAKELSPQLRDALARLRRRPGEDAAPAGAVLSAMTTDASGQRPCIWAVGEIRDAEEVLGFVAVKMNLQPLFAELTASPRHLTFVMNSQGKCLSTPREPAPYPYPRAAPRGSIASLVVGSAAWSEKTFEKQGLLLNGKFYGETSKEKLTFETAQSRQFMVARINQPPATFWQHLKRWYSNEWNPSWPEPTKEVLESLAKIESPTQVLSYPRSDSSRNSRLWRAYLGYELERINVPRADGTHPLLLFAVNLDGTNTRYLVSAADAAGLKQAQEVLRKALPAGMVAFSPDVGPLAGPQGFAGYYEQIQLGAGADSGDFLGVLTSASYTEMESEISRQLSWARILIVLTIVLIIVLALLALAYLSAPLERLRKVARDLASGEFDWAEIQDRLQLVIGRFGFYDEVRAFALSFDGMAAAIVERDHRLRQEVREKSATVSMLAEGLVTFDGSGAILSFNRAAEEIFGCTEQVMRGQNFETLFAREPCGSESAAALHDPSQSLEIRRITLALIRESIPEATLTASDSTNFKSTRVFRRWAWYGVRCGGLGFPCEVAVSKLRPFGGKEFYSLVTRDVTDQCQARERIARLNDELQQKNDELELRVSERTHELNQQRDQLLRTNNELTVSNAQASADLRALDSFMATMNHELRTPLNAIIGFSNMLKKDAEQSKNARAVKNLTFVLTAGQRLLELVNDILDLAKIRSGKVKMELTNFAISEVIDEAVVFCGPRAEEHKNQLVVSVAPGVPQGIFADRRRVGQIVLNLMSNAVKFTKNGTVTLAARQVTDADVDFIEFAVRDTGPGIAEADLSLLFRPFSQVGEGLGKHPGGTGLGLSITKTLTELMGGIVLPVESKLGVGSVFRVWIPCRVALESEAPGPIAQSSQVPQAASPAEAVGLLSPALASQTGPAAALRRSVLVIDDDPAQRELVSQMLQNSGFQVLMAESGEEGLALARQTHPDGILLDVLLPGIDGWNVLQQLKQDPATADTPVILISQLTDQQSGFGLGAADYLVKPVQRDRLLTILRRYCGAKPAGPILVVEDDEAQRSLMVQILQQEGWSVREAAHGKIALEHLASEHPALILLDLLMPIMDGFELLYELQKEEDWRSIPVVVVTSVDLDETTLRRLSGRVEQVLEKGAFRREDLLELVCRCMAYCPLESPSKPS